MLTASARQYRGAVHETADRFREPAVDPAWRDPVLVECPRCAGRAVVLGDRWAARLVCDACSLARDWHAGGVSSEPVPNGVEPRFGTPLWLRSECCGGELLWATNAAHLAYLEAYVGARLRDHAPGVAPLSSRLPAWMTSAKNRDEVVRHLGRLRRRLEGASA